MSKVGLELLVFIPTFYSERLENTNLWITSFDAFAKYLIHEQSKLIQMWSLKASKNQARLAGETKNAQEKRKQKGKEKKNTYFNPKEKHNPSKGAFGFNRDK